MRHNDGDWTDKIFPALPIIVMVLCIIFMIWFGCFVLEKLDSPLEFLRESRGY